MTRGLSLAQAIEEYLDWLDLDRHRSPRTITEYLANLGGFAEFASASPAAADVGAIERELLRAYQRHLAIAPRPRSEIEPSSCSSSQAGPGSRRSCASIAPTGAPTA